jgi:hypothetical protein
VLDVGGGRLIGVIISVHLLFHELSIVFAEMSSVSDNTTRPRKVSSFSHTPSPYVTDGWYAPMHTCLMYAWRLFPTSSFGCSYARRPSAIILKA